jgi:aminomethyltransferase
MKKTRLHSRHVDLKGKMIEFFGWEMPVEYIGGGIVEEHLAVRSQAGLFDVSHMGEVLVSGPQALDYVQFLTPNNAARTSPSKAQYSALTTPEGTFMDDMLVYCLDEGQKYLLVVNAANTDKDYAWIQSHTDGFEVTVENQSDLYSQMALQGRKARDILKTLTPVDLDELKSFDVVHTRVAGIESMVSRTGYTGEDGFEIYSRSDNPEVIWDSLMESGSVHGLKPIGLGARDTLRLEACLMLYGNDIDDTTTALEAGLRWLVKFKKGEFLGREALLKQKEEGLVRKLAGFEVLGRGIARPHYPVLVGGQKIGEVTSGTFSPLLKKSIGLAYLPIESTEAGTDLDIEIRGRGVPARVVELPFYKRDY